MSSFQKEMKCKINIVIKRDRLHAILELHGSRRKKNHKEPILEVSFMIPDSTAVILFPETHKQGNAAERKGEQLSRHQGGTE